MLNVGNVSTIIRPLQSSWRPWGNRVTDGSDPKFIYEPVRRAIDVINDSVQAGHLWAVDQPNRDARRGRACRRVGQRLSVVARPARPHRRRDLLQQSRPQHACQYRAGAGCSFDFEVTPAYPAEHITFRSLVTPKYLETIFL